MSNAHASSTPHHVGQVTKAEILVTHLLDTAPAGTDHQRQATVIVQQLQSDLGWTPPRDLTETPPLRGPSSDAEHRRAQIAAALAVADAKKRARRDTPTEGTPGNFEELPAS